MEVEEAALSGEVFDVEAGFGAQLLDGFALMADDDALLRFAFDKDETGYIVDAVALFVAVDDDFAAVGYLLLVVEEYLLAHDLADEEPHRLVGELAVGVIGGVLGQHGQYGVEDAADVESLGGGAGDDHGTWYLLLPAVYTLLYGLLVGEVYLVDDDEYGGLGSLQVVQQLLVLDGFANLGDEEQQVGVLQGGADIGHHLPVQLVGRIDDARGVGVDDLEGVAGDDAHDALARGLCLGGDDAEALAHKGVHERGFAHVGVADDIYESGFHKYF